MNCPWPDGLLTLPLRHLAEVRLGKMLRPESGAVSDLEVPYVRAGSLKGFPNLGELPTMYATPTEVDAYGVVAGDLVVAEGGDVGRSEFLPTLPLQTIIQNSLHRVRAVRLGTDIRFLKYCLEAVYSSGWLEVLCNKSTFGHLTHEKLVALPVPARNAQSQLAIANYLDVETSRIDALIAKKQQMIDLLQERLRAMCTQSVLGGLDPRTGTGQLPKNWVALRLGVLLALHRGFDLPAESRSDGPIPVISSGGVSGFHDQKACNGPGVVTGRYGTVGAVFYAEGPYWPLNTTLFVSEYRANDPRWVYYLLQAMPLDIDSSKSAVTGINRNIVGALWAPKPPIEEQRRLSSDLDEESTQVASVCTALGGQVELLVEHRQALITAAVTGEFDVPGVAV